ncbi:MAG TPA: type II/IV secretion system ATPase subunit [Candidatus Diapherotrites archaeon]|uniref:Type II/IV secretion system ATPase subunit n=1 Tax=Candidatus Iainarchaeum sp. TaxID=3101447 RepID=A0A7J4IUF8_9ARCH|nr:type II/IV secretion system ATPase subunit [Candidatus Diapherotrites archaeon]
MKYKEKDCENCDGLSDINFAQCRLCVKPTADLDLVIYKSKLFTKQHYIREKQFVMYPFFVDVLIKPVEGKVLGSYQVKDANVEIVSIENQIRPTYVIKTPQFERNYDELKELYKKYEQRDFSDPLLNTWIKKLGILNYLLLDPHIQEININPPEFQTPFIVVHDEFQECQTNIYPSIDFLEYLATRLKLESGRPLNKAQPQLDGELFVDNQRARVEAVTPPFSVHGIGYSIRKHRENPWTLVLFQKNKTLNDLFSGLMSFAISHGRTFLVAGPRGSGKTSLLGALILEILPKYRIITIEDTQELPVDKYKSLGLDLLSLKVRSALMAEGLEISFEHGLRTSLRLGDSCLVLGEVRSEEAKILYEAMRVGAMSMSVAGTIHADNPYGVYDRLVNDLNVPKGSFKVTDLIVIIKQIKSPSGLHRDRRVTQVTEVLKEWNDEPVFQDLLVYDPKTDALKATDILLKGKSVLINEIISKTRGYRNYDAALRDIFLRGWAKNEYLRLIGDNDSRLEAEYTSKANMVFTALFEEINPLEKADNIEKFQSEFTKRVSALLQQQQGG